MSVNTILSITSLLQHPPVDLLHLEAIPGNPHVGGNALTRPRGTRPVDAHGIYWNVLFAPPGFGLVVDIANNRYDRAVIEIAEYEQLLDGTLARSSVVSNDQAQGYYLFRGFIPYVIDVQLPPGLQMTLSWLVFF